MKLVNVIVLGLGLVLGLNSCKEKIKEDPEPDRPLLYYPVSVTKTANYDTDTLKSEYVYDNANQIIRENVFKNRQMQGFNLFQYGPTGSLSRKFYHTAAGLVVEQDEVSYFASNLDQAYRLSHAYIDAAGKATLHHYRIHSFNAAGNILSWTDYMPSGTVMNAREYTYPAAGLVISPFYDKDNQLLNTSEITFDTKNRPFQHTKTELVTFTGNETRHVVKNASGQEISAYSNTIIYNEGGYPEKITRNYTDGVIKTETYTYKN